RSPDTSRETPLTESTWLVCRYVVHLVCHPRRSSERYATGHDAFEHAVLFVKQTLLHALSCGKQAVNTCSPLISPQSAFWSGEQAPRVASTPTRCFLLPVPTFLRNPSLSRGVSSPLP